MSRYVRETGALRLEEAIKKITSDTAAIWGLPDRGLVREGYAADLVVFDPATLDRGPEVASDDFPGDGIRWVRHSVGMDAVVVGGEPTWTAAEGYVNLLETLHQDPSRKDIAWLLGIDEDVMSEDIRLAEVRNWIDRLVVPTMATRH